MTKKEMRYIVFKGVKGEVVMSFDPNDGGFGSGFAKALEEMQKEREGPIMVEDLELSERSEDALLGADLTRVVQLQDLTIDDLLTIEGMNPHMVAEVMVALRKCGLKK
ncbi:hypothetical protein DIE15_19905 [Burkholderia sp. Bp9031]|uniref:DNA-directed RNA polymerase subunit alpha C-terminal domain-containing protein n=1 Tax=Burkholderia sp. Bp9031 TaxID=2184566 RepID=UPI000F5E6DF3|nr:DNA-directed RNA polymerase subunit alpha C-terminal domain-containing protein [Burkholderia sp. Bp9031]RQZ14159.1 hypothetical protein DIE15_19905 [Burkholderia sp. Bp9031]